MVKFALLARLEAKPGKEQEVADFIKSALPLAQQEAETISWYALQIGPSTFGIFDTFENEEGRKRTYFLFIVQVAWRWIEANTFGAIAATFHTRALYAFSFENDFAIGEAGIGCRGDCDT